MAQVLSSDQYMETPERLTVFKKISWGAIIAGVLVAIVVQLLLSLLGLGIGLSTVEPMREADPMAGLGTGTLIWWSVSMLIALFAGGWVTGRESNLPSKTDRFLNGVIMWSLVTLISFYVIQNVTGRVIGGVTNLMGNVISGVANSETATAEIRNRAEGMTGPTERETARAENQARVSGEKVADAVSKAAFFGFIGLLVGALVSGFAARMASPVYEVLNVPGKTV